MTFGLGQLGGTLLGGKMLDHFTLRYDDQVTHQWLPYWLWPALMSGVILIFFFVAFRERIDLRPETTG